MLSLINKSIKFLFGNNKNEKEVDIEFELYSKSIRGKMKRERKEQEIIVNKYEFSLQTYRELHLLQSDEFVDMYFPTIEMDHKTRLIFNMNEISIDTDHFEDEVDIALGFVENILEKKNEEKKYKIHYQGKEYELGNEDLLTLLFSQFLDVIEREKLVIRHVNVNIMEYENQGNETNEI